MSPICVGLVGCGAWGLNILRDLRELGSEVAVVDRSPAARAAALAAGATGAFSRPDQLPAVRGIVVATPATTHASVVGELLSRGTPVFVEKPMATNLEQARLLLELAPQRLFVMHKWRYHPGIEALAAIARTGELGAVSGCCLERLGPRPRQSDVDAIWTLLPHDLSIGLEIMPDLPQPRSARAAFVAGTAVGLTALLGDAPWLSITLSGNSDEECRRARLFCRDGQVTLDGAYATELIVTRTVEGIAVETERRPFDAEWPLKRELRAFLDHLRGGPPPKSSAREGAQVVRRVVELRRLAGIDP
jgi:predicted dehydrogenase